MADQKPRVLKIHVPQGEDVPDLFTDPTADPTNTLLALRVGAALAPMVASCTDEATTAALSDLEAKHRTQLASLSAQHRQEMQETAATAQTRATATVEALKGQYAGDLKTQQDALERQRRLSSEEKERMERQHQEARDVLKSQQLAEIAALQVRCAFLESHRTTDLKEHEQRVTEPLKARIDDLQRVNQQLLEMQRTMGDRAEQLAKSHYELLLKERDSQIQTLTAMVTALTPEKKEVGSKKKGDAFENSFYHDLCEAWGSQIGFSIIHKAKEGHNADYHVGLWAGTFLGLLDNKAYTQDIPTSEVNKLQRDMDSNPQASFAIMVATYKVTGKHTRGTIFVEIVNQKLYFFINHYTSDKKYVLETILTTLQMWYMIHTEVDIDDTKPIMERKLRASLKRIKAKRSEWLKQRAGLEALIAWENEHLRNDEQEATDLLNILIGKSDCALEYSGSYFTDVTGNPRQEDIVKRLLQVVECTGSREDYVEETKLVELLLTTPSSSDTKLSKEGARNLLREVIQKEYHEPRPGKATLIRGLKLHVNELSAS